MISKVLCLFALVAVVVGAIHGHGPGPEHGHGHHTATSHQTIHLHSSPEHEEPHHEPHAHPKYEFEYKVEDHHTGDIKSQHESRDGDHVKGHYALHQPDGHEREVHYESNHKTGFHANVKYNVKHVVPHHHSHHHH